MNQIEEDEEFMMSEKFRATEGDAVRQRAKLNDVVLYEEEKYQSPQKEHPTLSLDSQEIQKKEAAKVKAAQIEGKMVINGGESDQIRAETDANTGKYSSPKEDKNKYTSEKISIKANFISNRDNERNKNSKRLIYSLKSLELQATTFITPFGKNEEEVRKEMEKIQQSQSQSSENDIAEKIAKQATEILERFPKQIKVLPACRSKTTRERKSVPLVRPPEEKLSTFYSNDLEINQAISDIQKLVASKPKMRFPTKEVKTEENNSNYLIPEGKPLTAEKKSLGKGYSFRSCCYNSNRSKSFSNFSSSQAIEEEVDENQELGFFNPCDEEDENENNPEEEEKKENGASNEKIEQEPENKPSENQNTLELNQPKDKNIFSFKTSFERKENIAADSGESHPPEFVTKVSLTEESVSSDDWIEGDSLEKNDENQENEDTQH